MATAARIKLTSDGDFDLSSGKMVLETNAGTNITAKVKKVLNLWRGSWFLAGADGVPWIQSILARKNPDLRIVENVLRDSIATIPEITSISSLNLVYNRVARSLAVTMALVTTEGAQVIKTPLTLP